MTILFWLCVAILEVLAFIAIVLVSVVVWNFITTRLRRRENREIDDNAKAYIRYRGLTRQRGR